MPPAATLTLTNVQSTDAGSYTVVVTNSVSSATSAVAVLTVWAPPVIAEHPTNRTVVAGTTASFSVGASGTPAPSYQWRKDGTNLSAATAASLVLPNASTSDAGNYDVVASNAAGETTSATAKLVVGVVPDPQLKAALNCALSMTNCPCTNSLDLAALSSLWACNYGITNLSGLELAANLTNLSLAGNAVSDLSPLTNLSHLAALEVQDNLVADLSVLSTLTNLLHLSVGGNPIVDYSTMPLLPHLRSLSVVNLSGRGAPMEELTSLENLTGLTSLTLWGNNLMDVSPLVTLTNLNSLDLRWTPITNQTALAEMQNLDRLYLGATSISNISFLGPLTQLRVLNLADNRISDLSPLSGLTNLNYLVLNGNRPLPNTSALAGLTGLVNLELRGCGITNLAFLSNLVQSRLRGPGSQPDH